MAERQIQTYLWRELKQIRGRLFATVLILGIAAGVFTGVYSAINGFFDYRDTLYDDTRVASHEIRFVPEDELNVPDFGSVDGVTDWEPRLLLSGSYEAAGSKRVSALMIAVDPELQQINKPLLLEGAVPARDDLQGALIDRNFARHYQLAPGDAITVKIGHDRIPLVVRGVAVFSEYLIDGAAPGFFMPSRGSLAVLQVSEALIRDRMGFRLLNSVVFAGQQAGHDLDASTIQAIETVARQRLSLEESVALSRQFGHMYLQMDLDAFKIFTPAICAILVLACAMVLAFVLRQWVLAHRSSIGVLLALGYRRMAIAQAWAAPLALVLVLGLITALLVGWLMMKGFGMEYANAIGMPLPDLRLSLQAFSIAVIVGGLLFFAVGAWALSVLRQAQPVDAMRETGASSSPAQGDIPVKSVLWRYPLRAVMRNRRVALGTVMVIALALAPAISFFVALYSFERTIVKGLASDRWDYTVDFISPVWDDELPELTARVPGARVEGFARGMVRVIGDAANESVLVTGVRAESMRQPRLIAGRWITPSDQDVVLLERRVVDKLNLSLGEPVQVEGMREGFAPILIGVVSGVMPSEAYATLGGVRQWLDLDEQNTGAMLAVDSPMPNGLATLFDIDWVARVMDKGAVTKEFVKHLREIAGILHLATLFSMVVAVLTLLISVIFSFATRQTDFALLQILGFHRNAVATMIRREVLLLGALGVVLSVPLAIMLAWGLNGVLGKAWLTVDTHFRMLDALMVVLPALLILPLVARPVVKAVRGLDPVAVIRRRKFG